MGHGPLFVRKAAAGPTQWLRLATHHRHPVLRASCLCHRPVPALPIRRCGHGRCLRPVGQGRAAEAGQQPVAGVEAVEQGDHCAERTEHGARWDGITAAAGERVEARRERHGREGRCLSGHVSTDSVGEARRLMAMGICFSAYEAGSVYLPKRHYESKFEPTGGSFWGASHRPS